MISKRFCRLCDSPLNENQFNSGQEICDHCKMIIKKTVDDSLIKRGVSDSFFIRAEIDKIKNRLKFLENKINKRKKEKKFI